MYLRTRFYYVVWAVVLLLVAGEFWQPLFVVGQVALAFLIGLLAVDWGLLYHRRHGLQAFRRCAARFSNGDDNKVYLTVSNTYPFPVRASVTDEAPPQFQLRDLCLQTSLRAGQSERLAYTLRPVCRGAYSFGFVRVFVSSPIGLVERRYTCDAPLTVKVYPSFHRFRTYELLAIGNRSVDPGVKRVRRAGHRTEFEQIREYVPGDSYQTVNWKASAHFNRLMVNLYQDECSQSVYCVIDKGRRMQSSFRQMTLFDYAVNASLMLSHIALYKGDQAGLFTFGEQTDTFLMAGRRKGQMQQILEVLYSQTAGFGESNLASLCLSVSRRVSKRSLLVLFTHFSGLESVNRSLPYLRQLASRHRLLVVYFADPELQAFASASPEDAEGYFQQATAEKYMLEEQTIAHSLRKHGITSVYTAPDSLTAAVVNKYLELKVRQAI